MGSRRPSPAPPPVFAALLLALAMAAGCGGGETASEPGATPAPALASPTPTPTPTPIPDILIRGSVAIKLPRGVDIPAGLPVLLLDARLLDALARDLAAKAEEELAGLAFRLGDVSRERAGARRRAAELALEIEALYREAWAKARDAAFAGANAQDPRLETILQSALVEGGPLGFLKEPSGSLPRTPEKALERAEALEAALEAVFQELTAQSALDQERARAELEKEKALFDETYQYRERPARESEERMREIQAQIDNNSYAKALLLVSEVQVAAASQAALLREEIARQRGIADQAKPRVEALRRNVERDFPRWQASRLKKMVRQATLAETHAGPDGRFAFKARPGEYVVFARYGDPVTGASYSWAEPADGNGEVVLGIYNTLSAERIGGHLPGLGLFLYGGAGASSGDR